MVARTIPVAPFDLVVFGATGDLVRRRLLPALYMRWRAGQMPPTARVVGVARGVPGAAAETPATDAFRDFARRALEEFAPAAGEVDADFLARLDFAAMDVRDAAAWSSLGARLGEAGSRVRAFYLSVAPELFGVIGGALAANGLAGDGARIVVEKPLGHDRASAGAVNDSLRAGFEESQIYRIDHYLGKETVQNLMVLRFANALLEPLWSARSIDHVQISVAETVGLEGRDYYEGTGALRDMVQNHLLQLLCLTAMEPPARFEADAIRDEKRKVIQALAPIAGAATATETARGQYAGYREDAGNLESRTETFAALRAEVRNARWSGTPFYLRTGKRLARRVSEVAVVFRDVPHSIFGEERHSDLRGNALIMRLQPDEAITLRMTIKEPGPGGLRLTEVPLDMTFAEALGPEVAMPDAYERLLMDVIRGNQTLFMRYDELDAAWSWIDPILAGWEGAPPLYEPGSEGPGEADALLSRDGRRWRRLTE